MSITWIRVVGRYIVRVDLLVDAASVERDACRADQEGREAVVGVALAAVIHHVLGYRFFLVGRVVFPEIPHLYEPVIRWNSIN